MCRNCGKGLFILFQQKLRHWVGICEICVRYNEVININQKDNLFGYGPGSSDPNGSSICSEYTTIR